MCLPLAFMAATGVLLGLSEQIERVYEPELYSVRASTKPALSPAQLRGKLQGYGALLQLESRPSVFDTYRASYTSAQGQQRQLWIHPYTGQVLADRPATARLYARIARWHRLGFTPAASVVATGSIVVFITGLLLFGRRHRGRYFWHSYAMLGVAPFALWQAASGLLYGTGFVPGLALSLHNPAHLSLKLLLVIAMLTLVGGLFFVLLAPWRKTL